MIRLNTPSTIDTAPTRLPFDLPSAQVNQANGTLSGKVRIELTWVESRNGKRASAHEVSLPRTAIVTISAALHILIRQAVKLRSLLNTKTMEMRYTPMIHLPNLDLKGIDTATADNNLRHE